MKLLIGCTLFKEKKKELKLEQPRGCSNLNKVEAKKFHSWIRAKLALGKGMYSLLYQSRQLNYNL